jgi:hypothetical protein
VSYTRNDKQLLNTDMGTPRERDYNIVSAISAGYPVDSAAKDSPIHTYTEYNRSLELTIRRNGPIAGTIATMWNNYNSAGQRTIVVDSHRQVRCYDNYDLAYAAFGFNSAKGKYTRCIRTGPGWNAQNRHVRFYTEKPWNWDLGRWDPGVNIDFYSSDKAVFFPNGQIPSWIPPACLNGGPLMNNTICPWERIFTTDPSSPMFNRTQNVNTIEYLMGNSTANTTLVVDFVGFYGFTTYSLDSSPVSNPLRFISTGDLPSTQPSSFPIDPAWYLAGWSVGEGENVLNNRTITMMLQSVMSKQLNDPYQGRFGLWQTDYTQDYVSMMPVLQTLSIVDYSTTPSKDGKDGTESQPVFSRSAQMYVWSYGIGSRTSYLGVAVAVAGCLVVLWQFALGFTDRRRYRSPTQLMVAALEHSPRGEFDGKNHDELAMARVRFHIRDNEVQAGKFSFYEPEVDGATNTTVR